MVGLTVLLLVASTIAQFYGSFVKGNQNFIGVYIEIICICIITFRQSFSHFAPKSFGKDPKWLVISGRRSHTPHSYFWTDCGTHIFVTLKNHETSRRHKTDFFPGHSGSLQNLTSWTFHRTRFRAYPQHPKHLACSCHLRSICHLLSK